MQVGLYAFSMYVQCSSYIIILNVCHLQVWILVCVIVHSVSLGTIVCLRTRACDCVDCIAMPYAALRPVQCEASLSWRVTYTAGCYSFRQPIIVWRSIQSVLPGWLAGTVLAGRPSHSEGYHRELPYGSRLTCPGVLVRRSAVSSGILRLIGGDSCRRRRRRRHSGPLPGRLVYVSVRRTALGRAVDVTVCRRDGRVVRGVVGDVVPPVHPPERARPPVRRRLPQLPLGAAP